MEFYFERADVGGGRVRLPEGTVSIGRSPKNTIVVPADERGVSGIHAVVYCSPQRLLLQDMQSTNGTFVNDRQVQECTLEIGDEVRLGQSGPVYRVVADGAAAAGESVGENTIAGAAPRFSAGLFAPEAESADLNFGGLNNDDDDIDLEMFKLDDYAEEAYTAGNASQKRSGSLPIRAIVIVALIITVIVIAFVGLMALLKPSTPKSPPRQNNFFRSSEEHSSTLSTDTSANIDNENETDQTPPVRNLPSSATTVARINAVLTRFGESDYDTPPEMIERVEHYITLYTGRRRSCFATYIERSKQYFPMIHRVFSEKNVPHELAYVAMIESGFNTQAVSHAGAAGLWQFMPATARRYKLVVSGSVDERNDPEKSTYAAAAHFRHLIAVFGGGSSVMLSMAAYNAGEQRIINALRRIEDPMRDRGFWYLYRMGWLAEETNEYIPKIIAAIILSEHREDYGF